MVDCYSSLNPAKFERYQAEALVYQHLHSSMAGFYAF